MTKKSIPDSQNNISGVYTITCTANGRVYVGSSINIEKRFAYHVWQLRSGVHENRHLLNAWNKYGEAAFVFRMIEAVPGPDRLIEREQFWMGRLSPGRTGFNIRQVADSNLGLKHSEETKRKISDSQRGQKRGPISEEHKRKLNDAWRGQKHSEETKQKLSEINHGRKHSEESRRNMSAAHLGKKTGPRSEEHQRKLNEAHRGQKRSEESKRKMSEAHKGKPLSAENRANISKSNKGRIVSEETRRKISETLRGRKKPHKPRDDKGRFVIESPDEKQSPH